MIHTDLQSTAAAAKESSRQLAALTSQAKQQVLEAVAAEIEGSAEAIFEANRQDVIAAKNHSSDGGTSSSALARMTLTDEKLSQMARSVNAVSGLENPVGNILLQSELDDGLELKKVSCPFGVIAGVVEARPDAVVQLSALALKSSNALMIKAGAEIARTTEALLGIFGSAYERAGISADALVNVKSREELHELLKLDQYVDLVVPRGSSELIRFVSANTRIPVLGHADGVCHIYVDDAADLHLATSVILDSKIQAPATCNAVETVLVHRRIASDFLPKLVNLLQLGGVKVRGCEKTRAISSAGMAVVNDDEWHTEYGSLTLALRVVESCDEAITHINHFGSHHTDSIISDDSEAAEKFLREVDSAGVFHNVSTRFSDGYRYGFGAEVGIATGKLHARGPVGLEGLVTYKYLLVGKGQCVSQYVGPQARKFKHELNATEVAVG
ncbi:MAG TPA: glutamate-5-semialdehyde dehydrogenase [Terriglobales bacterium]|nr:glutamate-5-semialdehyde dehydrogenase [Terriglobales bacterium]